MLGSARNNHLVIIFNFQLSLNFKIKDTRHHHEKIPQRPSLFPPTFLYTMSWEDPDVDVKVLNIQENDVILTLTSGGCNSLNLVLHGAKDVIFFFLIII